MAHLVAAAVQALYPKAKFGVGPVVDNGFYYDIEFPEKVSDEVLEKIEKKARELAKQKLSFERQEMKIEEAVKLFEKIGQSYKVELLKDLKKRGTTKMSAEELQDVGKSVKTVSLYRTGEFIDLCRGPHLKNTKELNLDGLKLIRLAGAYWRGSEKNPMLTRIYGVYFESKKELDEYLRMLEEAEKRDHRKLGKELDLFVFDDIIGKGLPMLTPHGTVIRKELEKFVLEEEIKRGYQHVITPHLARVDLYKKSGHYPYYKNTMYPVMKVDDEELILRPMTCPHHFILYKSKPHSYRELPLRIAEIASQFRYEKSGELSGLSRVRLFCLADAHIICAKEQAKQEIKNVLDLIDYMNKKLGLEKGVNYRYRLSLGDRNDDKKYYKDDEAWEKAETILREVLQETRAPFFEAQGEAAFYGPKIDIQMKKINGQEETAFTVQYDFVMPQRFELTYIDQNGKEVQPIVIHRSSIGCFERTMAFLIEHYAGAFPVWLSPAQVLFAPVAERHFEGAKKIAGEFSAAGIRVEIDSADETVGNKVRKAVERKIPYILVIGDKELSGENLFVRVRGLQKQEQINKEQFIKRVQTEIAERK